MKIETLKSGHKRTRVAYYENGKRRFKSITAPTLSELKILVSEFTIQAERVGGNGKTLRMCCLQYIKQRQNILSPSTIVGYKKTIKNEFKQIMDVDVGLINNFDLQYIINLMATRLSLKTIKNHYSFIHSVLVENTGRTYKVNFPPKQKQEVYIPNDDEVKKILEYVKGTRMEIPIMLGAYLGLRRGEICALTNKDVNLKNKTITINKAMVTNDQRKDVIKAPKTYQSYRTLDIPEPLYVLLKDKIEHNKPIIEVTLGIITHQFPRILEKLELPHFSFHKLRHYFISVCLKLGIPDTYTIKLSGHSAANTTILKQVYQHTMDDKEREVRDLIKKNFE